MRACTQCGAQYANDVGTCPTDGARLTDTDGGDDAAQARVGSMLGAYRLLKLLGQGGMGSVYLAEHVRLERQVAIKLLRPEYAANPVAVARFFGEARAVNKIKHENIVQITDFVENEGADKYCVMELLEGVSLGQQQRGGMLPLLRAIDIAIQIADALAAVHQAGIVHRDLKPDNVFLVERGAKRDLVKVLDFGVAKLGNMPEMAKTGAGALIGTPEYMSPEQISGADNVDYRTDIYAFGVILYELTTGRKPLNAKSFGEMVIKHISIIPTKPSRVPDLPHPIPPALESLTLGCLEKLPKDRPQSMAAQPGSPVPAVE